MSAARKFSRRRFIAITAGAVAAVSAGAIKAREASTVRWRGVAMGADASLILVDDDTRVSNRALKACVDEIARLEMILSLYEPNSDLSRLNRDGFLPNPSIDLVRCLSEARAISVLSNGAFDVSVQPLFEFYRARYSGRPNKGIAIDPRELAEIRSRVNFQHIHISAQAVRFRRKGMAATLNGIAQGYVCDRVAELLRNFGFDDAMVNLGEIAALGHGPKGRPWCVGIANPDDNEGEPLDMMRLEDRAVATSSPNGYVFDSLGRHHHLFDPHSGRPSNRYQSVSVAAPSATLADGLSTAMAAMSRQEIEAVLAKRAGLDVLLFDAEGKRLYLSSKV